MNRIKELREKAGKQQKELAIDLGVSQPTVSDWESGRKIPSAKSTSKIADYFQVPIDYLLGREPTPEGAPAPSRPGSKWIPVLGRVAAGKKANDEIRIYKSALYKNNITNIENLEFYFAVLDSDTFLESFKSNIISISK